MNSNLYVSDENLHRKLFSTSDRVKLLEQFAITGQESSVRKHSQIRMENTVIKILFTGTTTFQQENFLANEITIFRNLKTESLYIWLKAKDIAVSVITVYLIFQILKKCRKILIYLGLVRNAAYWQQPLRNLDPLTEYVCIINYSS